MKKWKSGFSEERREKYRKTQRIWNEKNKERRYELKNKRRKERIATDPEFKEKTLRSVREWARRNPEKASLSVRKVTLKRNFGITIEDYEQILEKQNGVCAICGGTEKVMRHRYGKLVTPCLSVDHCHISGVVRGLLCKTCNTALGRFNDDAERFQRAADYLRKYAQ